MAITLTNTRKKFYLIFTKNSYEIAYYALLSRIKLSSQIEGIQFVTLGILKETTGRKRDHRFIYKEYVDCLSDGTA